MKLNKLTTKTNQKYHQNNMTYLRTNMERRKKRSDRPYTLSYESAFKGQRKISASKVKVLIVYRTTDVRADMGTCYKNGGVKKD